MKKNNSEDIKGLIVGLEMKLSILEQDLKSIETDLCYLDTMYQDLNYNLNILKKDEIISVFSAYRLSQEQLKDVNKKIIEFKNTKLKLLRQIDQVTVNKNHYLDQFNSDIQKNNIIPFKKG